jgi:hypothetical protein
MAAMAKALVSRKLVSLLIPMLAVMAAWGLIAPAPSEAAVSVQRLGYCGGDDWEPAMASDSSHVYVLITHFAGDPTCDPASAQNKSRIMIQVSADGGKTFSAPAVVATSPGGIAYPNQADPAVAVDASTGAIYVSFLAYGLSGGHTDIYVARSTDFGQSFSQAVQANGKGCKNCDHEKILAASNVVYDAYTQGSSHFHIGLFGRRPDLEPAPPGQASCSPPGWTTGTTRSTAPSTTLTATTSGSAHRPMAGPPGRPLVSRSPSSIRLSLSPRLTDSCSPTATTPA